ncbi:MAG: hypothetical protein KGI08_09700, partial [Thaumarchaeota archaeon]|nr:hypothetical protein [Nitrososphaerota archaeon]
ERIMEWAQEEFSTRASSEAVVDMSMYPVLADFLNHHIDETLLMPTAAQGRREIPHIGDLPKKRITIRIELDSQTCIVNETTLRSWMEKNSGGGYGLLMKELAKNQHLKFAKKQVTLGAGTIASRGQVYCLAFDMGAPAFTGIIRSVNKVAKHEADIQERIIK